MGVLHMFIIKMSSFHNILIRGILLNVKYCCFVSLCVQEEFGSSVEQPFSPDALHEPSDVPHEDQTAEIIEEPDTQPARSDSSTPNLGMEDSGIGTESSGSGNFTKTADSEQLPTGIDTEGKYFSSPYIHVRMSRIATDCPGMSQDIICIYISSSI